MTSAVPTYWSKSPRNGWPAPSDRGVQSIFGSNSWNRTRVRIPLAVFLLGAAALAPMITIPLGAQQTDRAKRIGSKFMCMCNCYQVLTQCNHVGCQVSASMLKELDQRVARGDSDDLIVQSFVQEFGTAVFAEPPNRGFSRMAWWIPALALVAGLALVILLISRWRNRPAAVGGGPSAPDISPEFFERARQQADRETEE